ncbi:MAG TPA: GTP cyclohydrolase FolE2 [Steroidobacteraceae bacterium]|nr:GTP cyclohydrolase FolE2 [Steroidobacteraceae bacterium]
MSSAILVEDPLQGRTGTRQIFAYKLGIKDVLQSVKVMDRSRGSQHTVAKCNLYVNLTRNLEDPHMSRALEILGRYDHGISVDSLPEILAELTRCLDIPGGYVEMIFPYFVTKKAPISGVESVMNYQATISGEHRDARTEVWLKVVVPVTSLCPCSKQISDYGAHNQRSHVTLAVKLAEHMWLEELIDIAEHEASSDVYGILKRPDEKYVTERAYDNPKFVEDTVRDIAVILKKDERVKAYMVEVENFESIHNHSAYAMIEHDKEIAQYQQGEL